MTKLRNLGVLAVVVIVGMFALTNAEMFSGLYWTNDPEDEPVTLRAMWNTGNWVAITFKLNGETHTDHSRTSPWVRHLRSHKAKPVSMRVFDADAAAAGKGRVECLIVRAGQTESDIRNDGASARCDEARSINFDDLFSGK